MVRIIVATLVGGILLFVWQFAAWEILELHELDREPLLENEEAFVKALEGTERGAYWIPGMTTADRRDPDSEGHVAWKAKYEKGPRAFLIYDPGGDELNQVRVFGIGGAIAILISFVIVLILKGTKLRTWIGRVTLCIGLGVLIGLVMDIQNWHWMHFPDDWTRGFLLDHVGAMTLLGIVLGAIIRPTREDEFPAESEL